MATQTGRPLWNALAALSALTKTTSDHRLELEEVQNHAQAKAPMPPDPPTPPKGGQKFRKSEKTTVPFPEQKVKHVLHAHGSTELLTEGTLGGA